MPNQEYIRHGSYREYYKFRKQDSRPQHFEEILPQCLAELNRIDEKNNNKNAMIHLLDIGCNSGKLTNDILTVIQQSLRGTGRYVRGLGLDIDAELIEEAASTYTVSPVEFAQGDISAIALEQMIENPVGSCLNRNFTERFDFVTCCSTLMYVHLNHGDDVLRKVLAYLCSVTKILVLELHPWRKYRDQERRMRREGNGNYSYYGALEWRGAQGKLEQMVIDYVVGQGFNMICDQQNKNEFKMNFVVFAKTN